MLQGAPLRANQFDYNFLHLRSQDKNILPPLSHSFAYLEAAKESNSRMGPQRAMRHTGYLDFYLKMTKIQNENKMGHDKDNLPLPIDQKQDGGLSRPWPS